MTRSPAPWTLDDFGIITDPSGRVVAVVGDPDLNPTDEDHANGLLLVVAPEMLAELETIARWLGSMPLRDGLRNRARRLCDLLHRVRGETG